jgi:hypothetical protein
MRRIMLSVFLSVVGIHSTASAQKFIWWDTPYTAYGQTVSGDGKVAFGDYMGNTWWQGFSWTGSGSPVDLLPSGTSVPYDASRDGSVVVGDRQKPFRWTQATGFTYLSGGQGKATGVSADGSVVVGYDQTSGFVWTAEGGFQRIGGTPVSVSADGKRVAGNTSNQFGLWTAQNGWTTLGTLPGGTSGAHVHRISADGGTIVGGGDVPSHNWTAARWTAATGMESLGRLPGGSSNDSALGVSGDGSVIVGYAHDGFYQAFIWTAQDGMRKLQDVLVNDYGLDLTGWRLEYATDISDDGCTIVGYGRHGSYTQPFIAVIPEPSTILYFLAVVGFGLRRRPASLKRKCLWRR